MPPCRPGIVRRGAAVGAHRPPGRGAPVGAGLLLSGCRCEGWEGGAGLARCGAGGAQATGQQQRGPKTRGPAQRQGRQGQKRRQQQQAQVATVWQRQGAMGEGRHIGSQCAAGRAAAPAAARPSARPVPAGCTAPRPTLTQRTVISAAPTTSALGKMPTKRTRTTNRRTLLCPLPSPPPHSTPTFSILHLALDWRKSDFKSYKILNQAIN